MSRFKVEFTLKQHTPIIHFQADQKGATLRATELKPKFDKFLKEYAFNKGGIPKEFLIDKSKDALNYKVRIYGAKFKKYIYKTYVPRSADKKYMKAGAYFGNLEAIKFDKNIKIEFFSFNKKLLEKIEKYFEDFISITNFGTRQNKGFGSFSVIEKNGKRVEFHENILLKYYPKVYKTSSSDPLKKILDDYQHLKSGINRPFGKKPIYKKSLLFEYMCNKKIRWEKRMIKEYLKRKFQLKGRKSFLQCNNNDANFEYQYIRGLLGITENIMFEIKDEDIDKKKNKTHYEKISIKIKSCDKNIQRFKSPITYKVIGNSIYVLATNEIPVKDKKFRFIYNSNKKDILNNVIKIPKNFDIFKFLDFALVNRLSYKVLNNG